MVDLNDTTTKRVLVVDDDPELQQLVAVLLGRVGMSAIPAHSARAAAQALRQTPLPDLIVLDLMLPDVNGVEFLRQMRARDAYHALPVLVLSAIAAPAHIREALDAGADRYITKPYLANSLIGAVQDLLKNGRRARDLA